jgi:glycosyltransferase involved in cell wall biosynthesis
VAKKIIRQEERMNLISVIIPVYNGKQFLSEAVKSILQQKYNPLEIIIVDDGSTDGTIKSQNSFGKQVKHIYQDNKGPAAARNTGLAIAKGEFITFLDSDDVWPPNKLNTQINYLLQNPDLEVIIGHTKNFNSEITNTNKIFTEKDSFISVQLGSALFRKSAFEKVGTFDEELKFSEDHDWFLRAREKEIKILVLEDITLYHRRHSNNMTEGANQDTYKLTAILKKSLDRRRLQNDGKANSLPKLSDYIKKK